MVIYRIIFKLPYPPGLQETESISKVLDLSGLQTNFRLEYHFQAEL